MRRSFLRGFVPPPAALLAAAAVLLSIPSCVGDQPGATVTAPGPTPDGGSVDRIIGTFGTWPVSALTTTTPVSATTTSRIQHGVAYVCRDSTYQLTEANNDLVAVGLNSGVLWPGALIQGGSLQGGALASLPLARSPITVSVDLAIANPSRAIDNPTSASVQAAISHFQRQADASTAAGGVIPLRLSYVRQEAFSYAQSIISAGLSLAYSESPELQASLSADFSTSRSLNAHTIVVRLFQPMYTVSFADEAKPLSSDFFSATTNSAAIQAQVDAGTMGPANLPVYVKSVTYGRMMLFTLTSDSAYSASELSAAVSATVGAFEGTVAFSDSMKTILQNSRIQMTAFGGTQDAALNAIRTGNLNLFFVPAPASTAVPLSYRLNNLSDRSVAALSSTTTYTVHTCTPQLSYRFTVALDSVWHATNCSVTDNTTVASRLVDPDGGDVTMATSPYNGWSSLTGSVAVVNRRVGGTPFRIESELRNGTTQYLPILTGDWTATGQTGLTSYVTVPRTLTAASISNLTDQNGTLAGVADLTVRYQNPPAITVTVHCRYTATGTRTTSSFSLNLYLASGSDGGCSTEPYFYAFTDLHSGAITTFTPTTTTITLVPRKADGGIFPAVDEPVITFVRQGSPIVDELAGHVASLATTIASPYQLPNGVDTLVVSHRVGVGQLTATGQCSLEFSYRVIREFVFFAPPRQHPAADAPWRRGT